MKSAYNHRSIKIPWDPNPLSFYSFEAHSAPKKYEILGIINYCGVWGCKYRDCIFCLFVVWLADINECQQQTSECQFSEYCYDTYGSYTCRCPSGYILAPDRHKCLDFDECEYGYRYICSHGCQNLEGSYMCTCREGYVLQSGWYCSEVDECSTSIHRCDNSSRATCQNTEGSYICLCPSGFRTNENGLSCEGEWIEMIKEQKWRIFFKQLYRIDLLKKVLIPWRNGTHIDHNQLDDLLPFEPVIPCIIYHIGV